MAVREEFKVHRDAAGKRRLSRTSVPSAPVATTKIHEEVWATALRLASGDVRRIEILSPTSVRVRN